MLVVNNRFNVDCKTLTDEQSAFINLISSKYPKFNKGQILKMIIDKAINCSNFDKGIDHDSNQANDMQALIHEAVQSHQKELESNQQDIIIGTGKNARKVSVNNQSITIKWIQNNVTPTPTLANINEYMINHKDLFKKKSGRVYTSLGDAVNHFIEKIDKINIPEFNDVVSIEDAIDWIKKRLKAQNNQSGAIESLKKQNKVIGQKKVNYFQRIEKLCVDELSFLVSNHKLNTVAKTDIPAYKAAIKAKYPANTYKDESTRKTINHPVEIFLALNPETRKLMNQEYIKNVKNRQGERAFYDIDGYIKKACELLDSNKYTDIALGLCAATGRRPGEIFATAKFSECSDTFIQFGEWQVSFSEGVKFSGQMKTKNDARSQDEYTIPVLCPVDKIINALNKLRELKDFSGKTPKQVDSSTSSRMGVAARKIFSDHFSNGVKPYDLRHAYALICATKYCDNPNQWGKFFSAILGHGEGDMATKESYMTLKLIDHDKYNLL